MAYRFINAAGVAGEGAWASAPVDGGLSPLWGWPSAAPSRTLPVCAELDCLRNLLPPGILAAAELRAAEVGVGADRALIAADIISEEAYLAALSASLDMRFEPLEDIARDACPLPDERLIEAAAVGILPFNKAGKLEFVVAPRLLAARSLVALRKTGHEFADRIRITSSDRMQQFIARHGAQALAQRASQSLRSARPDLSAGTRKPRTIAAALLLAMLVPVLLVAPNHFWIAVEFTLGAVFLAWAGLRLVSPLTSRRLLHAPKNLPDDRLPVYTIIVALYREAAGVKDLVAALRRLDYPGIMAQTPLNQRR